MAKELPDYQRRAEIKPAANVFGKGGSQSTFEHHASRIANAGIESDVSGEIGASIAQSSANALAEQAGIEAAKNPGGWAAFMPPIGESGKVFAKAYQHEEYQNLLAQKNQFVQQMHFIADQEQRPTNKTLKEFASSTLKGLKELIELASPGNKEGLKRAAEESYNQAFYELSKKVNQQNLKELKARSDNNMQIGVETFQNDLLLGNYTKAEQGLKDTLGNVYNRVPLGLSTEVQVHDTAEKIKQYYFNAEAQGRWLQEIRKSGDTGILEKEILEGEFLEGATPVQRMEAIRSLNSFANTYNAAMSTQENINFTKWGGILETGGLRDEASVSQAMSELNPLNQEKLKSKILKRDYEERKETESFLDIARNSDNPVALANKSGKEIEKYTNSAFALAEQNYGLEPGTLPMADKVAIVQGLKAENPVMTNQISAMLKSEDPQTMYAATQAYVQLDDKNPISVSGIGEKQALIAKSMNNYVRNGLSVDEASQLVSKNIVGVDESTIKFREKEYTENNKKVNTKTLKNMTANELGFSFSEVPVGLINDYQSMAKDFYIKTGDMQLARKFAADAIKKVWGETTVNDKREIMYVPPDRYLPTEQIKEQLIKSLQNVSEVSKKAFDKDETNSYYKINEKPFLMTEDNYEEYLKKLEVSIVYRNGETIDGKLVIEADKHTAAEENGVPPSYLLSIQTKNGKRPLHDIYNHPMRYKPDLTNYLKTEEERRKKVIKEKQLEKELEAKYLPTLYDSGLFE